MGLCSLQYKPRDIVSNVVVQLNKVTGTLGLVNKADILVIVELHQSSSSCTLTKIVNAYEQVVIGIGKNWEKAKLIEYPQAFCNHSEEDSFLFIKTEDIYMSEYELIKALANQFELENSLSTGSFFHRFPENYYWDLVCYMWIKKKKLELAKSALNLQIESEI